MATRVSAEQVLINECSWGKMKWFGCAHCKNSVTMWRTHCKEFYKHFVYNKELFDPISSGIYKEKDVILDKIF